MKYNSALNRFRITVALSQPWNTHFCLPLLVYCSALYVLLWGIKHTAIKATIMALILLSTQHSSSLSHSVPNSNPLGVLGTECCACKLLSKTTNYVNSAYVCLHYEPHTGVQSSDRSHFMF